MLISYQVLLQVDGDIDAAIEFLIAEREADDNSAENDSLQCHADTSYGNVWSVILTPIERL